LAFVDAQPGNEKKADQPDLTEAREIKVKLPVSLHIKLHGIKITRHRSISQVVLEALEEYFKKMERGEKV
jgi:hypothetical protein